MTPSRHLVIAGTGRAGTSFLVGWLRDHGADVGEFGPTDWHEDANAGLERRFDSDGPLPFVVKDPWLYLYLDVIDPGRVEALVIPVRPIAEVAASRITNEQHVIARTAPHLAGAGAFGWVSGGAIVDLSVESQAKTIALGFHELIQWATHHDITTVLIDFTRLNDDAYLESRLGEWLCT